MTEQADQPSDALRSAAAKRVQLKQAVSLVEIAAASPSAVPGWREALVGELDALRAALLDHVEEVEAPDGLLAELTAQAPRLVKQIASVRDEHPGLCNQVDELLANVKGGAEVDVVRAEVLEALSAIARHRQKGADLVYEGYDVDIGGGG